MTQGFYEQLGVDPQASTPEIREAYTRGVAQLQRRRKALVDQGGDPAQLDARRKQLDEAWSVLSSTARRRRYDAMLALEAEGRPETGDELWDRAAGALVHPAVGAAADLLRVSTNLGVGVLPIAPRPGGDIRDGDDGDGDTFTATLPTAVPEDEVTTGPPPIAVPRPGASVVPLPTAADEPPRPTLRVVDGAPSSAGVIVLPTAERGDEEEEAQPTPPPPPADVPTLVEQHGYSGALLAAVRRQQGMSLQEMSDSSRISVRYLEAIESDDYDRLPSATFVRGYVREMARLLDLDESAVVAGFMRRFSGDR